MTARTPLKLDGDGNLVEMTPGEITRIKRHAKYLWGTNPVITLSQVASGGDLTTISDTRYQAGDWEFSVSAYPSEATTAEPSVVTVNYDKILSAIDSAGATPIVPDTNNVAFPVYLDGSNHINAMTDSDFYDTFIVDSIAEIVTDGDNAPGVYTIHTATSLTGYTLVSATPIYTDTRADTTAYTAAEIPEANDQPVTITNYYLLQKDADSDENIPLPVYVRNADKDLQQYDSASFDTMLEDTMRYVSRNIVGSKLSYNIDGSGTVLGSGMANTVLTGVTGDYQTRFVNSNDYRAQEFPNGTPTTSATHYLRIEKV